jgi:MFS family permease
MSLSSIHIPSIRQFQRDTRLLLIATGILSLGIFGIQTLIKVLYILRLGYGLEYVGLFAATPALAFMTMSLPSGALGNRFGLKPMMITGAAVSTSGMALLPLTEFVPVWATDGWPILCQILTMAGWAMFEINMVPSLMAATTNETRDNAYALMSMLRGAGTFLGTIIGGFLPLLFATILHTSQAVPDPYRYSLIVGASFGVLGMILLKQLANVDATVVETRETTHNPFPVKIVAFAVIHVFLSHGGYAACNSFCNAYMDTELNLSSATIGILFGIGQFFAIFAPVMMPVLVARRSNTWTMMVTSFGIAVFLMPLAWIPNWFAATVGLTGVLALMAIWMPTVQVFQMNTIEQALALTCVRHGCHGYEL